MSNKFRKPLIVAGCVIMLVGIIGLAYPFVGSYINSRQQYKVVDDYKREVVNFVDEEAEAYLEEAREYNRWLFSRSRATTDLNSEQMEDYYGILDMSVTGIMGYLDIPKIKASLPIYHGVDDAVLQMGVGHLPGSSFPVGGKNTHAVLTGHSGIPDSELFTRLDELEVGDTFSVTVLTNTATYRVYDISTKLPDDVKLGFEEGKDYCTLITCTPIGVNTHRLVVRGERVKEEISAKEETSGKEVLSFD